jgi:ABC-2 type transport system permease protein
MSALNAADEMGVAAQEFAVKERATQPFLWSVRRELWESNSIYLGPAIVAGLAVLLSLVSLVLLSRRVDGAAVIGPDGPAALVSGIAMLTVLVATLAGFIYCMDALYGERRDRSILFWKSMPVSDTTAVLAKASIPIVVLPVVTFVTVLVAQMVLLVLCTILLPFLRVPVAQVWVLLPLLKTDAVLAYVLMAMTLWYAPIYGWLLLVSGWARRPPIFWAILPPLVLIGMEGAVFHTTQLARALGYCFSGAFREAFASGGRGHGGFVLLSQETPLRLLSSLHLWVGLVAAAGFLVAAVRLRRYREPI